MGFLHIFGHEGHDHTVSASMVPWWQDQLSVSVVIIIAFVTMLLMAHYLFKARFAVKIILAMAFLLVAGVAGYTVTPILSIAALSVGMFLALTTTLLQLAHKKQPR